MLAKWNPFANGGIARSAPQMPVFDDLFREFESAFSQPTSWGVSAFAPADIYETQDELVMRLDLPGHDPKAIDIQVEGDVLTLRSQRNEEPQKAQWLRHERPQGQFARSFVLPNTVEAGKCEARFEHGVLTLTLPKREEAKPRSITVKVQS